VFDLAPFPAAGLVWVGSQLVSYTGRSGSSGPGTLTGIPAAGVGALLAPAAVGAEVIVAAHLSGCTGLVYAINKGDPVNVVVTVNDAAAQAVMAALVGGDGITEYFITDGRWSVVECTARGTAELTKRKDPLLTITFDSRDPTLVSGRAVTITLTSPAITGTFTIQRVTFSEIGIFPVGDPTWPLRHVECSSTRYSFEDLLRQIKGKAA